MVKSVSIQSLIYKNYLTSSLVPILMIELLLLLLYCFTNRYIADKNQHILVQKATHNLQDISSWEATKINNQLKEVSRYARLMQRDHQAFFANTNACFLPHGEPEFATYKNGAYYKLKNNSGASLYYSATTPIEETEKLKARCSEMLDPLLKSIVETSPIITQAYLNTWDGMNRLYPFMENAPEQYGPVLDIHKFNFYYEADTQHDPERKPVWTEAYLDPAGQGWMISNISPIYHHDFLEGVSGLDVTIESFIENILNLNMPWDGTALVVDKNGTILAMQEKIEQLLKLKELTTHIYHENIKQTIRKPASYNIFTARNKSFAKQMRIIFDSKEQMSKMSINGITYFVNQQLIPETGWRMFTLVKESLILAPTNKQKELNWQLSYLAIAVMIIFYIVFSLFILHKTHKLTSKIATPIKNLSNLTRKLGGNRKIQNIEASGIIEIDQLNHNFRSMLNELDTRNDALIEAQLREKMRQKESELLERLAQTDTLTRLYNRRKLDKELTAENERAKRFNHPYGIVLLDIDHFKKVNDTYGHQTGDQVLVEIAKLLKKHTRKTDVVGRWGGEEFLIICPGSNKDGLIKLAQKLKKSIEDYHFSTVNHQTSSFGMSLYQQRDETKDIISRADKALYKAKEKGRNRIEYQ